MILSWNWLKDYVSLPESCQELADRLMMAGLNHEGTATIGDDLAVDLEITSNRADCLGHIGIAREIAVLWDRELRTPAAKPESGKERAGDLARVDLLCTEMCPRYTARVIRGVKVGPSPGWMVKRLETLGVAAVNNVVDVSNYVLFECGQPLHAFDLSKLIGGRIIVREARAGEKLLAINHKSYELSPGMCVIADAERPIGLGGVMGGADSEVTESTTDLLIEAADFNPVSIRATARNLNLHSDSSYRFERGVDPCGIDWASRRCCELILQCAGGELADGVIDVGETPPRGKPVTLRYSQLGRILGIDIPQVEVRRILTALGNAETNSTPQAVQVTPPSWRRDLTREIDLVEEVARIYGYDRIPEDVNVPMAASTRTTSDEVLSRVRHVLTSCGFDEAMTLSVVTEDISSVLSPWSDSPPLKTSMPIVRGAHCLRRSLVPSLLAARRENEKLANASAELFEIARIYLPRDSGLPEEKLVLAIISGQGFRYVKGVLEGLLAELKIEHPLDASESPVPMLGVAAKLVLDREVWGFLGELSDEALKQFELRSATTIAEIAVSAVVSRANLVPQMVELSPYPAIERDINLVVDESVRWGDLGSVVRTAAGKHLISLRYVDTYRDEKRLGANKKSILFSLSFQSETETLTNEQADAFRDRIVAACRKECAAELRT